jgi:opacity protein-like surface antigen
MFKRSMIAGAALAALTVSAFAGDIASPAPTLPSLITKGFQPCQVATATTPLSCSGAYIGFGIAGQGSNADIIGSGINGSVFAGGITPSIDAGYQYVSGNWLFGAELDLGYSFNNSVQVNAVGGGFNGLRISEVFKVGGNAAALLGTQQPITIPPQLANAVLAPYGHLDTVQWQLGTGNAWASGLGSGAGVLFDFGPRIFGDLRYTYTNFNSAKTLIGTTIQNDQSLRFSVNYKLN